MRKFAHINVSTLEEAVSALRRYGNRARLIAGGTDLLGTMKDDILPAYPEAVIDLKMVPDLDYIRQDDGVIRIGALTRLEDIARSPLIKKQFSALAEAARRTASAHIREMGTIGGNLCQDVRCWYYRAPKNRFPCLRKGGGRCYAIDGENRYHSIFGGSVDEGCYAVNPSDTAPALVALDAIIKTTKRTLEVNDFFTVGVCKTTVLEDDEIVSEIRIPVLPEESKSWFVKFALRKSIDFPIVNCAARISRSGLLVESARICLNAVYVTPFRAVEAEESLIGKEISQASAEAAGKIAVSRAKPLSQNGYMVQIAKTMTTRALLSLS